MKPTRPFSPRTRANYGTAEAEGRRHRRSVDHLVGRQWTDHKRKDHFVRAARKTPDYAAQAYVLRKRQLPSMAPVAASETWPEVSDPANTWSSVSNPSNSWTQVTDPENQWE